MHIPGLINASTYPFYSQESIGGLHLPDFASVNETLTQTQPNRVMKFGQYVIDGEGNIGQYVSVAATLAAGNPVKKAVTATSTIATADATGDNIHVLKTGFTGATVNSLVGRTIWIDGYGLYEILANTATVTSVTYITISRKDTRFARGGYDGNALSSAAANTTKAAIIRRYNVDVCGAGEIPVGVAVGVITSAGSGLVLVHGLGQVLAAASGTALTDGGVMVTAASGTVTGPTATETVAEVRSQVGVSQFAYTPASSGQLIPGLVFLFGRL